MNNLELLQTDLGLTITIFLWLCWPLIGLVLGVIFYLVDDWIKEFGHD